MTKLSNEQIRGVMFETLKEFASFCSTHHLRYYLAYGTLLGAVRHKGFIPWDDDIDVMMPEEDFLKMLSLYKSGDYELVDCYKALDLLLPMGRLYDTHTYGVRPGRRERERGIHIDIYLMYGSPDKATLDLKKYYKKYNYYVHRLHFWRLCGIKLSTWHVSDKWNPLLRIARHYSMKYIKFYQKHPFGEGHHTLVTSDFRFYKTSSLEKTAELPFEDGIFCAPYDYDEWLTVRYKDYMQLPPLSEQKPRHTSTYYQID